MNVIARARGARIAVLGARLSFDLRGEAGFVRTEGRSDASVVQGTRAFAGDFGGSLDAAVTFAARAVDAAFRMDLEIGAMTGPRIVPTSVQPYDHRIDVAGFMASFRIGVAF